MQIAAVLDSLVLAGYCKWKRKDVYMICTLYSVLLIYVQKVNIMKYIQVKNVCFFCLDEIFHKKDRLQ